ncbi:MAG: Glucokinase [Chlamydiia bacterium]|nr:Glucokinase [Chlamydiia bacterium]
MNKGDRFLVADVGATKVHFFLAILEEKARVIKEEKYLCEKYNSLEDVILEFLGDEKISYLVAGVPGPVKKGKSNLTNLSWKIDSFLIKETCKISSVVILNDLELLGHGVDSLLEEDLIVLQKGQKDSSKPKAVLSVGTGLGEGIVFNGSVIATEGGHEDFAAFSEEEISFVKFMKQKLAHISYERILSGEGIENVYEFFSGKRDLTPKEIFAKDSLFCEQTREFFLQVLGKESGNFALKTLCYGGLYLSGGVLQKNALFLQQKSFIESFCNKGRLSNLLSNIPIYLIKEDTSLLYGGLSILENLTRKQKKIKKTL